MKNVQELEEALLAKQGIIPAQHAIGTVNGASFDTKNFDTVMIDLNIGVISATGTLDVKIQESSDDGVADAFSDIALAVFAQKTVSDNNSIQKGRIKCKNFERHLRVVAVIGTDVADAGVVVNLGKFDGLVPVTQNLTPAFAIDYVSDGGKVGSEAT